MRHLFIALLIALLPLRGWVSDAMATEMVVAQVQIQQQGASNAIAEHAHAVGEQAHIDPDTVAAKAGLAAADCSGHASGEKPHAADTHCESCSACQACHTVALSSAPAFTASAAFNLSTLPRAAVAQFTSAQAARGQKPPIS